MQLDYIEFIENGLSFNVSEASQLQVEDVAEDQIFDFAQLYLATIKANDDPFMRPRLEKIAYRPIIHKRFLRSAPGEEKLGVFDFDRNFLPINFSKAIELLYSLLVFSETVVVRDPLPFFLTYFYQDGSLNEPKYRARRNLIVYLKWLGVVKPLYEQRGIDFYGGSKANRYRFRDGSTIGRYRFEGVDESETLHVNSFLDEIDEVGLLTNDYDADFFLNHPYAVTAYEYWMFANDRATRRREYQRLDNINSLLKLNLPLFACDHENEFVKIISEEDSMGMLRSFLSEFFQDISNIDQISVKAIKRELVADAAAKIAEIDKLASSSKSLKSRSTRFNLYGGIVDAATINPMILKRVSDQFKKVGTLKSAARVLGHIQYAAEI